MAQRKLLLHDINPSNIFERSSVGTFSVERTTDRGFNPWLTHGPHRGFSPFPGINFSWSLLGNRVHTRVRVQWYCMFPVHWGLGPQISFLACVRDALACVRVLWCECDVCSRVFPELYPLKKVIFLKDFSVLFCLNKSLTVIMHVYLLR